MDTANLSQKIPVLFDHDGSADDFLSLLLLLTMEEIHLQGVSITPADCYAEQAVEPRLSCSLLASAQPFQFASASTMASMLFRRNGAPSRGY